MVSFIPPSKDKAFREISFKTTEKFAFGRHIDGEVVSQRRTKLGALINTGKIFNGDQE